MSDLQISPAAILETGAFACPEKPALAWGEERVSYRQLEQRTAALGARLASLGAQPGDRIALLGRNSVDYGIALLALMRWGLVAVPLNWRLAEAALAGATRNYEPRFLLHGEEFAEASGRLGEEVPSLERVLSIAGAGAGSAAPPWRFDPAGEELVAVISTGGTEGTPKGVPLTQAALQASVLNALAVERMEADEVVLILPQMFHNPHYYLLPPLLMRATLIVPDTQTFDAELLLRTIEAERVTRFLGVATMMRFLDDAQRKLGADLSSLRQVTYGGAPFAPALLREVTQTFECDFVQVYGQTETSVAISSLSARDHRRALAEESWAHLLGSAGTIVPLMRVRVLDEDGADCPKDRAAVGEIAVQGPSVMQGYWRDPARTAEVLADGWLRTGDLATWDEQGYLYIADRRNDMIISGGENVYPQAVESVLQMHPDVSQACVVGVADPTWGEVVTAVIVVPRGAPSTDELSRLCRENLAGYMCPRAFHLAEALPTHPSGKVLRREVKAELAASDSGDE